MTTNLKPKTGQFEFIALMALLTAIEALSIDAMLPALSLIGKSLNAPGNQPQLIIGAIFLGVAFGQLISGALSDSIGRRPAVFIFTALYLVGTAICAFATNFDQMLGGRLLQGFGSTGPYVVSLAIIRDRYQGREMAKISSFVLSVFILVPVVAPLLGQGILLIAEWRAIFIALAVFAAVLMIWFAIRQPETLLPEARMKLSVHSFAVAAGEVLKTRVLMVYTCVNGMTLGAFIGYLSSGAQIFQDVYHQGIMFPVYFALLSISIGIAGALNGVLVEKLGMRRLTGTAFALLAVASLVFMFWAQTYDGVPPFAGLLVWLAISTFCFGTSFGNMAAMAMEPLGEKAGMGATIYGFISTLIAILVGSFVGQGFDGTVVPLAIGFAAGPAVALVLMFLDGGSPWRERSGV
ncbi:MAG: multidrug effflux MFS transporter [Pikeienuella sp.]